MKYAKTVTAVFLERPNRFVAEVDIDGKRETVHVKNTGRCRELLVPGRPVILAESDNTARKYRYDLISVEKPGLGWVNIDSQAPNQVVLEWLKTKPSPFRDMTYLKPEYRIGDSRIDFYLEAGDRKILIEVKGCTLERDRIGYFPDAPTERGAKHLRELRASVNEGYECYIAFVIAMPGVTEVRPNAETDPAFSEAFYEALEGGVQVLHLPCAVKPDELLVDREFL